MRGLIMSGGLSPGSVVRPETVGAALGISTTPAREGRPTLDLLAAHFEARRRSPVIDIGAP